MITLQIANKLYKTKIDANPIVAEHKVNPLIQDSKVTRNITITLTDFNNNPVPNEEVTIQCNKGFWQNNQQTYTATTNDNGIATAQHSLSVDWTEYIFNIMHHNFNDYGLTTFTCNEANIVVQTYYYSTTIRPTNNSSTVVYQSGYTDYGSTDPLTVHRTNNFVELTGRWKPTAQKTASDSAVHFATIPPEFAPSKNIKMLQQGSERATYLLTVDTNGKLSWSRYGTTSSVAFPKNGWGVVHAHWMLTEDDYYA